MFLNHRYRLGFEPLFLEVADSISWQLFCRIPLGGRVPHLTTLMKITGSGCRTCGGSGDEGSGGTPERGVPDRAGGGSPAEGAGGR
jgi:hypothetical protein